MLDSESTVVSHRILAFYDPPLLNFLEHAFRCIIVSTVIFYYLNCISGMIVCLNLFWSTYLLNH
jgi:hypothetical protein